MYTMHLINSKLGTSIQNTFWHSYPEMDVAMFCVDIEIVAFATRQIISEKDGFSTKC